MPRGLPLSHVLRDPIAAHDKIIDVIASPWERWHRYENGVDILLSFAPGEALRRRDHLAPDQPISFPTLDLLPIWIFPPR